MQKYLWKKSGLVVIGMLYLFLAWKGKKDDNGERTGTGGGTAGST